MVIIASGHRVSERSTALAQEQHGDDVWRDEQADGGPVIKQLGGAEECRCGMDGGVRLACRGRGGHAKRLTGCEGASTLPAGKGPSYWRFLVFSITGAARIGLNGGLLDGCLAGLHGQGGLCFGRYGKQRRMALIGFSQGGPDGTAYQRS